MAENELLSKSLKKMIFKEIWGLPPLQPAMFGIGFLIQFIVNMPKDDRLGFLPAGAAAALSSYILHMVSCLAFHLLSILPSNTKTGWPRTRKILKGITIACTVCQGLLVAMLFLYALFYHAEVDFKMAGSPTYVRERVYRYTLVSATLMFIALLVAIVLLINFKVTKPRYAPNAELTSKLKLLLTPSVPYISQGLDILFITIYVAAPGSDDNQKGIFLLELCLWFGSIVVFLNILAKLSRVAVLIAVRDGYTNLTEKKIVLIIKAGFYTVLGIQLLIVSIIFGQSLVISALGWAYSPNLVQVCLVVSVAGLGVGLVAFTWGGILGTSSKDSLNSSANNQI